MTVEPSIHSENFQQAWETFAESVQNAFQAASSDEAARPIAAKQTRYVIANMAIARLLQDVGQPDIASEFHLLAEALQDVVEGIPHPMFKVERQSARGRPGRINNTSAVWRIQSSLCTGVRYIIAGGTSEEAAISEVSRKFKQQLGSLLRPNANLQSSIKTWLKKFATDEVSNEVALGAYKLGERYLEQLIPITEPQKLGQVGRDLVAKAAQRAALLPRI